MLLQCLQPRTDIDDKSTNKGLRMRLGVQVSTAAGLKYFMYLPGLVVDQIEIKTKKKRIKK